MNRIPSVFNPELSDHEEFRPILDWVFKRKTMLVYGGRSYKTELAKLGKYLKVLSEMKTAGQIYEADDKSVDAAEKEIRRKYHHSKFNDQALVAIVIVSRCRLICSNDKESFQFLTKRSLYPKDLKPPKLYTGKRNQPLFNDRDILHNCGPCH